jgi:RES domain-containing protein
MRRLYRVGPEKYLGRFNGLGASYTDGARWNLPESPVIYYATSPAIALLEMANYLVSPRHVPASYRIGAFEFTEEVQIDELAETDLPENWAEFPHPESTQRLGTEWLDSNSAVGLLVPSCTVPMVTPGEGLIVVNPGHLDIRKLQLVEITGVIYNERMFSKGEG